MREERNMCVYSLRCLRGGVGINMVCSKRNKTIISKIFKLRNDNVSYLDKCGEISSETTERVHVGK